MAWTPTGSLRRVLGLTEVTAGGVGVIIGAGIYVLLGAAAAEAGALVWVAFLIAAFTSTLTALSYAELSSMFPSAAGGYEYARHAMPEWIALVVGWTTVAGLVLGGATVSIGFAHYVAYFATFAARGAAPALLVAVSLVAIAGIKQSARLALALSAIQVGGLAIVVAIGLPHVGEIDLLAGSGAGGVLRAAALVFFAFLGFDKVIALAEETRDPTRTVPRALLLALGVSTILYGAVAVAAVSVLGVDALARSPRPLADVMDHVLGTGGAAVGAAIAILTTTNTTLLIVTAGSRLMYGMAEQGAMPAAFAAVDPVRGTPVRAIVAVALASAAVAALGDFVIVAQLTDFAVYVVFFAANATVIILRRTCPELPRPFAIAWSLGRVPVLPVLALLTVVIMMSQLQGLVIALGTALCAAGLGAARLARR